MTRDLLAKICAASFGLIFCAAFIEWFSRSLGQPFHAQHSLAGSYLTMGLAATAACTLLSGTFVSFTRKYAREEGRWQIMFLLAFVVAGVCVLFVVGLQAPIWLPALLVAPFVLAFVCPGFAFWQLGDVPVATPDDEDASAAKAKLAQTLSDFPWLQRLAALAVVLFILWTVSHVQFYERTDSNLGLYMLLWVLMFPIYLGSKWCWWSIAPLVWISRKLGVGAIFTVLLIFVLVFVGFSFAGDALPYALTKRFGTDTQYEAEVRGREWYPNRLYCKGELEISESRGWRNFDRCFDHPSDYPGFEVSTRVHITRRESFAGEYVSQVEVAK